MKRYRSEVRGFLVEFPTFKAPNKVLKHIMMFSKLIKYILGSRNQRVLRRLKKTVVQINALEPSMQALSNQELAAKTNEFRQRLQQGESLQKLLPEAFAVAREASVRTFGMRHFDVQLIGGMVLNSGAIAEMRTGEGKTLSATLPAYLNALTGKGVHVVTVNDYLAKRDANWMRPLYEFLGLSVGVVLHDMTPLQKRDAYAADITYGTNNEFGFDYLRDNMVLSLDEKVQRELNYAIVDEVDSILIDEARTPLIISGAAEQSSEMYIQMNRVVPLLKKQAKEGDEGDFVVDEKTKQVYLTEAGIARIEDLLVRQHILPEHESLYSTQNISLMHHLNAALRAHYLFSRDVDYIVSNDEIIIVDEHTGRTMPGRRWSDGLHQAVEAKESVSIRSENQTLASITFQNYFRLYQKLSGMTGTADTEAYEFQQIYGLEVIVVPTNKPMIRDDASDLIYLNKEHKYSAIIQDVKQRVAKGQPVLVGTVSIETSEYVSKLLQKEKIKHQVLNAKFHEQEAQIIAEAGRPGNVTIATNMAGRGTDIVLGGNLEAEMVALGEEVSDEQKRALKEHWQKRHQAVIEAGGLHIIGTERHESRRIDNQLRGRSGRQGDPGSTRFYLSLEDNLMRIFASDRVAGIMQRLGMNENQPIEHPWITRAIENAQRKVEGHNFDTRKQLLEYDDVANEQRKVFYTERAGLLQHDDISAVIEAIRQEVFIELLKDYIPPESFEDQWNIEGLEQILESEFALKLNIADWLAQEDHIDASVILQRIIEASSEAYHEKEQLIGSEIMRHFEKSILLQCMDNHWREHLAAMEHLRQGIHLRGYAQRDPRQEYKRESFTLFQQMLNNVKYAALSFIATTKVRTQHDVEIVDEQNRKQVDHLKLEHENVENLFDEHHAANDINTVTSFVRAQPKVGRNDPCPCGSGKKFKHCHGQIEVI